MPEKRYATLDSAFLPLRWRILRAPFLPLLSKNSSAMHLTLFVPDLLWPDMEQTTAFDFTGADQLASVLSRAEMTRTHMDRTTSWESRLATLFGFSDTHPPLAALRSLGDGLAPADSWLCTDPVNLDFVQQSLVLSPIAADTLTDADVGLLLNSLNEEFAGQGRFVAGPDQTNACHWYFIPEGNRSVLPDLAACSRLAGRRIDADETRDLLGRDGLFWINRIQMCLNDHPINHAREAAGLPRINSLWPWGAGRLEDIPSPRFSLTQGNSVLLAGLCHATQTPIAPGSHFAPNSDHQLVTDLRLATAVVHDDLSGWQTAVSQLMNDWIDPAYAALTDRRGALQSLTLISPDAHYERRWTLHRSNKSVSGSLLRRWLGIGGKTPALGTLVRSWSA